MDAITVIVVIAIIILCIKLGINAFSDMHESPKAEERKPIRVEVKEYKEDEKKHIKKTYVTDGTSSKLKGKLVSDETHHKHDSYIIDAQTTEDFLISMPDPEKWRCERCGILYSYVQSRCAVCGGKQSSMSDR